MRLLLQQNLNQRLTLLQELGLKSDYFDSCFVRTEKLLQRKYYQRALLLLEREDTDYSGILDWYLGTASPSWRLHIKAFYDGRCGRLIEYLPFDEIDKMDQILAAILYDLRGCRRNRRIATQWVRHVAEDLLPPAPALEERKIA